MRTLILPRTVLTMIMTDAQDRGAGHEGSLIGQAITLEGDNAGSWKMQKAQQADAALNYIVLEGSEPEAERLDDMENTSFKVQVLLGTKGVIQLHAWNCAGDTSEKVHLKI